MPPKAGRLGWIDALRGVLICLVVLFHVTRVYVEHFLVPGSPGQVGFEALLAGIRPVRMPLFFFISGVLAAGVIGRSWSTLLRNRTLMFAWVYVLWLAVQSVTMSATWVPTLVSPGSGPAPQDQPAWSIFFGTLLAPSFLWFIFALALYFPLAKLVIRFGWVPLVPAVVAYVLSVDGWPGPTWVSQLPGVVAFFAFFYAGLLLRERVLSQEKVRVRWYVLGGAMFVVAQAIELALGRSVPALLLVASVGAVLVGIPVAKAASRLEWVRAPLGYVGGNTLPIYTLHMPLVWVILKVTVEARPGLVITSLGAAVLLDVVVCALVIGVCLLAHVLLRKRAPWLWALPGRRPVAPIMQTTAHGADRARGDA